MKALEITIAGRVRSGKSTMAQAIMRTLQKAGCLVTYENDNGEQLPDRTEEQIAKILPGTVVTIRETYIRGGQ